MLKPMTLALVIASISISSAFANTTKQTLPLVDRVERLERMAENPVLLQLSRRLGDLNTQLQLLQDENDRLKREMKLLKAKQDEQYKETDDRFSQLTETMTLSSLESPEVVAVVDETKPSTDEKLQSNTKPANQDSNPVAEKTTPSVKEVDVKPKSDDLDTETLAPLVQIKQTSPTETVAPNTSTQPDRKTSELKVIKTRPATAEERAAYKSAFNLIKSGDYKDAIEAFNEFRADFPESSLASNASYWNGEAYLIEDNTDAALEAFLDVVNTYPESSKAPASMLRAADTYQNLKLKEDARLLYQRLIKAFPDNRMAAKAKNRLKDL